MKRMVRVDHPDLSDSLVNYCGIMESSATPR